APGLLRDGDADQHRRRHGPAGAVLRRDVDEGLPRPGRGGRRLGFAAMPSSGTVVITGASTGIGRATALRLARAGFAVLAGVRRDEDGADLRAQDGRIEPV